MAFSEVKRTRGRKQITLPSGDKIYIPVIVSMTYLDQNGQETEHHYINTDEVANRQIHVDNVTSTIVDANGAATSDPGTQADPGNLAVERIDVWLGQDDIELAQESKFLLDNSTGSDTAPPRFTTHLKTHIYRYYQDPSNADDSGIWVDSELIDEISVVDQNGQEWLYFLDNPFNEDTRSGDFSGQASADDADVTIGSGEGTSDTPVRTDPFQNIVNWNAGYELMITFGWTDYNVSEDFYVIKDWEWTIPSDLQISLTPPAGVKVISNIFQKFPYTFGQSGTVPGQKPAGWTSFNSSNSYLHQFNYKITAPAAGQILTFAGSASANTDGSGATDYTSEIFVQTPPSPAVYVTSLRNQGPFASLGITIKKGGKIIYNSSVYATSVFSGPLLGQVGWTDWYRTGIFSDGTLELKLGNLASTANPEQQIACWASKPLMRTVPNVDVAGTLLDYNLGIYNANADWISTTGQGLFPFGKSPEDANIYTGTNPPPF